MTIAVTVITTITTITTITATITTDTIPPPSRTTLPAQPLSVRGSIIFHDLAGLTKGVRVLLGDGASEAPLKAIRTKDRISSPVGSGYRDVLMNVAVPNTDGLVAELLLHMRDVVNIKPAEHNNYKLFRAVSLDRLDSRRKFSASLQKNSQNEDASTEGDVLFFLSSFYRVHESDATATQLVLFPAVGRAHPQNNTWACRQTGRCGFASPTIYDVAVGDRQGRDAMEAAR